MSDQYQPFEIDLNMEEVESWDGQQRPLFPVSNDVHFKIVGVDNDGKQITVQSEALEGEHAGNRVWTNYHYANAVGQKRLKTLMVACGAGLSRINSDELLGATYYGDVIHQDGKATVDAMGNPRPARTFANVINERRELAEGAAAEAEVPPPPVTRSAPAASEAPAKPSTSRGRRA